MVGGKQAEKKQEKTADKPLETSPPQKRSPKQVTHCISVSLSCQGGKPTMLHSLPNTTTSSGSGNSIYWREEGRKREHDEMQAPQRDQHINY